MRNLQLLEAAHICLVLEDESVCGIPAEGLAPGAACVTTHFGQGALSGDVLVVSKWHPGADGRNP